MENVRKGSMLMPAVPEDEYPPPMPPVPSIPQQQPQPQPPQQRPQYQQPPQQQHPVPQKQNYPSLSPQPISQSPPQSAYPPGQRPLPGGSKPFGNLTRYTLTDPPRSSSTQGPGGPGPTPPRIRTPEPGNRPTNQQNRLSARPPSQHDSQQGPPPQPKPSHTPQPIVNTAPPPGTGFDQDPYLRKPQTFQEMGIPTTKVADEGCVIM